MPQHETRLNPGDAIDVWHKHVLDNKNGYRDLHNFVFDTSQIALRFQELGVSLSSNNTQQRSKKVQKRSKKKHKTSKKKHKTPKKKHKKSKKKHKTSKNDSKRPTSDSSMLADDGNSPKRWDHTSPHSVANENNLTDISHNENTSSNDMSSPWVTISPTVFVDDRLLVSRSNRQTHEHISNSVLSRMTSLNDENSHSNQSDSNSGLPASNNQVQLLANKRSLSRDFSNNNNNIEINSMGSNDFSCNTKNNAKISIGHSVISTLKSECNENQASVHQRSLSPDYTNNNNNNNNIEINSTGSNDFSCNNNSARIVTSRSVLPRLKNESELVFGKCIEQLTKFNTYMIDNLLKNVKNGIELNCSTLSTNEIFEWFDCLNKEPNEQSVMNLLNSNNNYNILFNNDSISMNSNMSSVNYNNINLSHSKKTTTNANLNLLNDKNNNDTSMYDNNSNKNNVNGNYNNTNHINNHDSMGMNNDKNTIGTNLNSINDYQNSNNNITNNNYNNTNHSKNQNTADNNNNSLNNNNDCNNTNHSNSNKSNNNNCDSMSDDSLFNNHDSVMDNNNNTNTKQSLSWCGSPLDMEGVLNLTDYSNYNNDNHSNSNNTTGINLNSSIEHNNNNNYNSMSINNNMINGNNNHDSISNNDSNSNDNITNGNLLTSSCNTNHSNSNSNNTIGTQRIAHNGNYNSNFTNNCQNGSNGSCFNNGYGMNLMNDCQNGSNGRRFNNGHGTVVSDGNSVYTSYSQMSWLHNSSKPLAPTPTPNEPSYATGFMSTN